MENKQNMYNMRFIIYTEDLKTERTLMRCFNDGFFTFNKFIGPMTNGIHDSFVNVLYTILITEYCIIIITIVTIGK